jgi:prophage antirepressor-like protein
MTNTIQHFGLSEDQIIRRKGEFYFSTKQISQILGMPVKTVQQNVYRHKEEFGEILVDSKSTNSAGRPSMLLDEEQLYIYCMISRSPKARELHRAFAKVIKAIRKREFVHISEVEKLKHQLEDHYNYANCLHKIPARKLTRYKKYRKLGMNRKELCKALDLPYSTMKAADRALGFYKPNPGAAKYLEPYHVMPGGKRRYQLEGLRQDFDGAQSDNGREA